mmetsp:Transcript_103364/g.210971  ORF Transcript_103364/g.210971 Transcript_103364/m.210971 type:complete len:214 (-) Transcript_103364:275-916(-)
MSRPRNSIRTISDSFEKNSWCGITSIAGTRIGCASGFVDCCVHAGTRRAATEHLNYSSEISFASLVFIRAVRRDLFLGCCVCMEPDSDGRSLVSLPGENRGGSSTFHRLSSGETNLCTNTENSTGMRACLRLLYTIADTTKAGTHHTKRTNQSRLRTNAGDGCLPAMPRDVPSSREGRRTTERTGLCIEGCDSMRCDAMQSNAGFCGRRINPL